MGKFKDFMVGEAGLGLGNLGARIDGFVNSQSMDAKVNGAFTTSDMDGTDLPPKSGQWQHLPSNDLTIPSTVKQGRISVLDKSKNPIYIRMSDGTELAMSHDDYRRAFDRNNNPEPKVGSLVTVTMQRRPDDTSQGHSKIEKIRVDD